MLILFEIIKIKKKLEGHGKVAYFDSCGLEDTLSIKNKIG
jgi:hypothetical protein